MEEEPFYSNVEPRDLDENWSYIHDIGSSQRFGCWEIWALGLLLQGAQ